jgi:hypothetical protein
VIQRLYAARRTGLKQEMFGCPRRLCACPPPGARRRGVRPPSAGRSYGWSGRRRLGVPDRRRGDFDQGWWRRRRRRRSPGKGRRRERVQFETHPHQDVCASSSRAAARRLFLTHITNETMPFWRWWRWRRSSSEALRGQSLSPQVRDWTIPGSPCGRRDRSPSSPLEAHVPDRPAGRGSVRACAGCSISTLGFRTAAARRHLGAGPPYELGYHKRHVNIDETVQLRNGPRPGRQRWRRPARPRRLLPRRFL